MRDTARKKAGRQGAPTREQQLVITAMVDARATLREAVVSAGMSVLAAMLEEDRTALCGPRYEHDAGRNAVRAGHAMGELAFGGRRVRVRRPRVRGVDGREVPLSTWERFACDDPLNERAVEQMVLGVSTRNYARSLEPTPPSLPSRGTSKSAVSRRFVTATREHLARMMSGDLSTLAIRVVMIDGIHVGEHVVLVALGVDEAGDKHILGLYEGATENATVCMGLLGDLTARGLPTDRGTLFVIDGSKALHKAIRAAFGACAIFQRCQVHKRRNVLDHLPDDMKDPVGRTISTAYRCGHAGRAKRMLEALARQLEKKHPAAAASLREGLDETLTVMRFDLPHGLARTLSTTNPIEFVNSRIRKTTHNVTRWESGTMILRWLAVALDEAAKTFRKLRDYKGMPSLVAALRAHDANVATRPVDAVVNAA
jgi:transposase-like protein